jgi:hypothetical protein
VLLRTWVLSALAILFSFPAVANTVVIRYDVISLGGEQFQYDYSVFNNGSLPGGVPVQIFDIDFDPALYTALSVATPDPLASHWNELILNPVPPGPADLDVEVANGNNGIAVGTTVSGFAVDFTWLGGPGSRPGSQQFEIFSQNFATLQTVDTVQGTVPTVPEPSVFSLLLVGAGMAIVILRRRSAARSLTAG